MKQLQFSVRIAAPVAAVWKTMLEQETYRVWTAEFVEGSYYEGSWAEGERIRFLSPSGEGMTSVIAQNRPHQYLSIKHLGYIKDGVEDTGSEQVRSWAPAFENYTFRAVENGTEIVVDMDVTPEFEQYMSNTWPKALARLRTLCEGTAR